MVRFPYYIPFRNRFFLKLGCVQASGALSLLDFWGAVVEFHSYAISGYWGDFPMALKLENA